MDVEQVAEELYGLRPEEFTAARDAYVAEARKAKDTATARAIAALRRPALAAWAANLLARRRREEAQQFLALGETLRRAHRTLDAEQLRTAGRQQHQLVTELARTAAGLAREAGQPVSETVLHEIEQTLHGVLAHPEVAELWAKGRLVKVPESAVGFAAVAPEEAAPRTAPAPARPTAPDKGKRDRGHKLGRARAAAEKAGAEVTARERELEAAQEAQRDAAARVDDAKERVRRLENELPEARKNERQAQKAAKEAAAAAESAEHALRTARDAAGQAEREADRLDG